MRRSAEEGRVPYWRRRGQLRRCRASESIGAASLGSAGSCWLGGSHSHWAPTAAKNLPPVLLSSTAHAGGDTTGSSARRRNNGRSASRSASRCCAATLTRLEAPWRWSFLDAWRSGLWLLCLRIRTLLLRDDGAGGGRHRCSISRRKTWEIAWSPNRWRVLFYCQLLFHLQHLRTPSGCTRFRLGCSSFLWNGFASTRSTLARCPSQWLCCGALWTGCPRT